MSNIYVSSVIGNDTFNGTTWALAKATITGGLAIAGTGDMVLVDSAHAESVSSAAITWDVPTTGFNVSIISVNRNGSITTGYSARLAGATATVSTNAFGFNIQTTRAGVLYIEGVSMAVSSSSSGFNLINLGGALGAQITMKSCTLTTPGISTAAGIVCGVSSGSSRNSSLISLYDCTVNCPNVAGGHVFYASLARVFISNLTLTFNGTKPQTLIAGNLAMMSDFEIRDSDLSGFSAASSAYVNVANLYGGQVTLQNCKLSSTPTITAGTWPTSNETRVITINCDSGDTKTKFGYYTRLGTALSTESIYRTTTPAAQMGTVPVGWQIVTTSACNEAEPFILPLFSNGFDTHTTAITTTIHIVHDSATNMHNRNIWMEYEYVSSASFPIGTLGSSRNASPFDGSTVDWPTDTDTWTGTGGFSNLNKQKVTSGVAAGTTTFTPAEGSNVTGRLIVGVASKTLYADPQIVIT